MQIKNLLKQIHAQQNSVTHANSPPTSEHLPNWNELNICLWNQREIWSWLQFCLISVNPEVHEQEGVKCTNNSANKVFQLQIVMFSIKEHYQTWFFTMAIFKFKILK